jgi:hypothetical protein
LHSSHDRVDPVAIREQLVVELRERVQLIERELAMDLERAKAARAASVEIVVDETDDRVARRGRRR